MVRVDTGRLHGELARYVRAKRQLDIDELTSAAYPHLTALAVAAFGDTEGETEPDLVYRLLRKGATTAPFVTGELEGLGSVDPQAVRLLFGLTSQTRWARLSDRQKIAGEVYERALSYNTFRKPSEMNKHIAAMALGVTQFLEGPGSEHLRDRTVNQFEGIARADYLRRLDTALNVQRRGGFILLWGPSGYGKSVLSRQARYKVGPSEVSATINMSLDPALMSEDLERVLEREGIDIPAGFAGDVRTFFARSIKTFRNVRLLVLDNVQAWDQVQSLFRSEPGIPVLITSQLNLADQEVSAGMFADGSVIEVGPVDIDEGVAILEDLVDGVELALARELVTKLAGHPLCIDQAARYLSDHGAGQLPSLLHDLQLDAYDALDSIASVLDAPNGLLVLYRKALDELEDMEVPQVLLKVLVWCSTDVGIDQEAARQLVSQMLFRSVTLARFAAAVSRLRRVGFVRTTTDGQLHLHDLTRAIVLSLWLDLMDITGLTAERAQLIEPDLAEPAPWFADYQQRKQVTAKSVRFISKSLSARSSRKFAPIHFDYLFWGYWYVTLSQPKGRTRGYAHVVINVDQGEMAVRFRGLPRWHSVTNAPFREMVTTAIEIYESALDGAVFRPIAPSGTVEISPANVLWDPEILTRVMNEDGHVVNGNVSTPDSD